MEEPTLGYMGEQFNTEDVATSCYDKSILYSYIEPEVNLSMEEPTFRHAGEHLNIGTTASIFDDVQHCASAYSDYNFVRYLEEDNLYFNGLGENHTDGLLMGSGQSKERLVFPRPVVNPIPVGVQASPAEVPSSSIEFDSEYWSNDHESASPYVGPRSDAKLGGSEEGSPTPRNPHSGRSDAEDVTTCPDCMARFTGTYRRSNCARHRRRNHSREQYTYTCTEDQCGKTFLRQDARRKHLWLRHGLNKPQARRGIE